MTRVTKVLVRRAALWPPERGGRAARFVMLLSAVMVVSQCRTARDTAMSGTPRESEQSVTMERGPCYGTCPVYAVRVGGDGEIRYRGTANVAHVGESVARMPRGRVDSLFMYIDSISFDHLDPSYTYGTITCGPYVTDLPTVVVSVARSGVAKRVTHDYGCGAAPGTLLELHRRIDETAETQHWIGGP